LKYHPKHLEQFPHINKLCNDAFFWIYEYTGILLGDHHILHISRIRVKSGIGCIYQFNTKYFTAYVSIFSSILHYDLAHVFDFHLFSSKTSHSSYHIFPGIWRSQKFSLQDTPFFFSKISMPQKGSRSGLESGFKVIVRCKALTALFALRSSIHGGTDGRTSCKQLLISWALLWQKHQTKSKEYTCHAYSICDSFIRVCWGIRIYGCVWKCQCFY
jgi:hypothetical protein